MPATSIRRIQNLTETDLGDIVDVCLRAFHDEASTPGMVGGHDELRPLLFSAMIRPGAVEGHLYVLEINEKIISVTLWFSPGHKLWSSEEQRSLGYSELMEKLSEEDKDWWKNTYGAQGSEFLKKTIDVSFDKIWWTTLVATDPGHQRLGYGSMIMQFMLENVITSPAHAGLCATSKENEGFYNRLGYPTRGFTTIPSRFGEIPVYSHLRKV